MKINELQQSIAMELQEIKKKVKDQSVITIQGSEVALVNKELNIEVKMNAYTSPKYNHELAVKVSEFILEDIVDGMLKKAGISVVPQDVYVME